MKLDFADFSCVMRFFKKHRRESNSPLKIKCAHQSDKSFCFTSIVYCIEKLDQFFGVIIHFFSANPWAKYPL